MLQEEEAGTNKPTREKVMKFFLVIVYIACGFSLFGSFAGDLIGETYSQYLLYTVMALIAVNKANPVIFLNNIRNHSLCPEI